MTSDIGSSDTPTVAKYPSALSSAAARDLVALAEQLGRPLRGVAGIAARCVCSRPLVVVTAPRLPDGSPFPTLYYLTHPGAVAAASALEQAGVMREMNTRLRAAPSLAAAHQAAHEVYLADRASLASGAWGEVLGDDSNAGCRVGDLSGQGGEPVDAPGSVGVDVPEIAGVSAGGMPTRVKCLHALMAHALARPGVNPFGEEALAFAAPRWRRDRCTC